MWLVAVVKNYEIFLQNDTAGDNNSYYIYVAIIIHEYLYTYLGILTCRTVSSYCDVAESPK